MIYKKILKNNLKTKKLFQKLPKLYIICKFNKFCILEVIGTCKNDKDGIPYIYDYYDCNGICDEYRLCKLTHLSNVCCWTTSEIVADNLVNKLNKEDK